MLFLLLGVPADAEAGIISSLLGNEANAQPLNLPETKPSNNSQTMTLLQASKLPPVTGDKKNEVSDDQNNATAISNNALVPATSPLGVSDGKEVEEFTFEQVSVYIVRKGDSISQIAEMFDVSVSTIMSANDIKKGESVKEGDVLLILPFSGIEHTITKGQTLKTIATTYKVELGDILSANNIEIGTNLPVGEKLIIPGAETENEKPTAPKKVATTKPKSTQSSSTVSLSGLFKNPVPGARRTRGITVTHKGVDLAAPEGTPIYAPAAGKVLVARMGFNGGFGNMVIIQHANGVKTLYAHMSKLGTGAGDTVAQGETIGYVGNTGSSRGNHLHIEVLGGKNPF
ncbi:MAG: peptidoglycan DD-metalloendopeptidase family protein [Patescibacteria group bacterium]